VPSVLPATHTICHFNGIGPSGVPGWQDLALVMRTSADHGMTWTAPRPISSGARYGPRHQVIAGGVALRDGTLVQACDGTHKGDGPSAVHLSRDRGKTWVDSGGNIRGIHAGVAELAGPPDPPDLQRPALPLNLAWLKVSNDGP
jgi:hypothetical protein